MVKIFARGQSIKKTMSEGEPPGLLPLRVAASTSRRKAPGGVTRIPAEIVTDVVIQVCPHKT